MLGLVAAGRGPEFELESIRVDSHVLLAAVGSDHKALRSLDVSSSPMRTTVGCRGCHAPMDWGAGFRFAHDPPVFQGAVPRLGEHTAAVLGELGLSD